MSAATISIAGALLSLCIHARRRCASDVRRESLIVRPHPQDLHNSLLVEDLVDETMLDADSPGIRPGEIANELLERGRRPARVALESTDVVYGVVDPEGS